MNQDQKRSISNVCAMEKMVKIKVVCGVASGRCFFKRFAKDPITEFLRVAQFEKTDGSVDYRLVSLDTLKHLKSLGFIDDETFKIGTTYDIDSEPVKRDYTDLFVTDLCDMVGGQTKLARIINKSPRTVRAYVSENKVPDGDMLNAVIDYLKSTMSNYENFLNHYDVPTE